MYKFCFVTCTENKNNVDSNDGNPPSQNGSENISLSEIKHKV